MTVKSAKNVPSKKPTAAPKKNSSAFKNPAEAERAESVGVECVYTQVKEGKEVIHNAALKIGEWTFELSMKDEATARSMARDIARTLEAKVEKRVEERLKEEKKSAKKAA
jgi:hypothetical protein